MSGFIALVHLDGRPVDAGQLERLTSQMDYRGPDERGLKVIQSVGLGHTLLRTTFESELETQPLSLDGAVWICADARVDDHQRLRHELEEVGQGAPASASDSELILRSYHAWGKQCVDHLIGDFAFVIWDQRRQLLLSARDHFGVKPLYFAHRGQTLIIGNTFDTLLSHPEVSYRLDELAIADQLLFAFPQDAATTDYRDVRRLPPAHSLLFESGSVSIGRYWSLPEEEPLRYQNAEDYVDQFNEIFGLAVRDRIRSASVAINMSGGLDSTAVAATALRVLKSADRGCDLKAFTGVYDHLIPDQERYWAQMAADYLGIPIHFTVADEYPSAFGDFLERSGSTTEGPTQSEVFQAHLRALADHSRVALTGFGGDPLQRGSSRCYLDPLLRGRLVELAKDIREVFREQKKPPLLLRTMWRRWRASRRKLHSFPEWIDPDFSHRLDLPSRWREAHGEVRAGWSARPELESAFWPVLFESNDPGGTHFLVEYRHPFFDLRVVRYMLRVPPLPWFLSKVLLRRAMQEQLPDALLKRPKTVLAGDPEKLELGQQGGDWWARRLAASPVIDRYVDVDRYLQSVEDALRTGLYDPEMLTRPLTLAAFLEQEERRSRATGNPVPSSLQ